MIPGIERVTDIIQELRSFSEESICISLQLIIDDDFWRVLWHLLGRQSLSSIGKLIPNDDDILLPTKDEATCHLHTLRTCQPLIYLNADVKTSRHFGWALYKYHFVLVLFNLLPRSNSVSQQYGSLLKTNVWTSIIHLVEVDPRESTIYLRIRYSADVLFRLFFCSLCAWVRDHPTFVSSFSFTYLHRWDIFVFSRIILIASAS